jgi:hypothetical protein
MGHLEKGLQATRERIDAAARAAGRDPAAVTLLAVSKTFPATAVAAARAAGQRCFGENYVQEAVAKIEALAGLADIEWHLIGPLQSNKAKLAAERFDWVQSVDREKIARALAAARPPDRPPLSVCVQVNVSGEATKSGVRPDEALALATVVAALPRLRLRGIMGIPEPTADPAQARSQFRALADCFRRCREAGLAVDTLSMGMSADLESAIAEGATMVRVGTAIFGARG